MLGNDSKSNTGRGQWRPREKEWFSPRSPIAMLICQGACNHVVLGYWFSNHKVLLDPLNKEGLWNSQKSSTSCTLLQGPAGGGSALTGVFWGPQGGRDAGLGKHKDLSRADSQN